MNCIAIIATNQCTYTKEMQQKSSTISGSNNVYLNASVCPSEYLLLLNCLIELSKYEQYHVVKKFIGHSCSPSLFTKSSQKLSKEKPKFNFRVNYYSQIPPRFPRCCFCVRLTAPLNLSPIHLKLLVHVHLLHSTCTRSLRIIGQRLRGAVSRTQKLHLGNLKMI